MRVKEPLRIAIVGCGRIAQEAHIPSLLKIRNVELAAVCDKNEDLAREVSEKFHISRHYADLAEILASEGPDVVDICTSPQTHLALSIQAMEAGCHVLVEKPMALSLNEADEMIDASKRGQVRLCVVHSKLFEPVVMRAKAIVSDGGIGDLVGLHVTDLTPKRYGWIMDKEHWSHKLPGGVFGEMLPHPIYLAVAFLGTLEPVAVYAKKLTSYDWIGADEVRVILEGKSGVGTILSSINTLEDNVILDILGTKMNLYVNLCNSVLITYGIGGSRLVSRGLENLSQSFSILVSTAFTALNMILGRQHRGHYLLIRRFIESIQNNTEPPVTLEEAREVMRVLDKVTAQI